MVIFQFFIKRFKCILSGKKEFWLFFSNHFGKKVSAWLLNGGSQCAIFVTHCIRSRTMLMSFLFFSPWKKEAENKKGWTWFKSEKSSRVYKQTTDKKTDGFLFNIKSASFLKLCCLNPLWFLYNFSIIVLLKFWN